MTNEQHPPTMPPPVYPPRPPQQVVIKKGISPLWIIFILILCGSLFGIAMICSVASDMNYQSQFGARVGNETVVEEGNSNKKILIVPIRGIIGITTMFPSNQGVSIGSIEKYLKSAENDNDIVGYLLDVNSPGGSGYVSDEILRILKKYTAGKPVYAHYRGIAASGGVYVSCFAKKIFCDPTGITGSIGVKIETINFAGLMDKAGLKLEVVKSSEMKDLLSPFRPTSEKERVVIQEIVDDAYERFVSFVAEGRGLTVEQVKEFADGRIFTPKRALEYKLIDSIANVDQVYSELRATHGDVSFVEYTKLPSLLDVLANARMNNLSFAEKLLPYIPKQGAPMIMFLYGE